MRRGLSSPQLLMLSGIGPATYLEEMNLGVVRDMPGVGQSLFAQPHCTVQAKAKAGIVPGTDVPHDTTFLGFTGRVPSLPSEIHLSTPLATTWTGMLINEGEVTFNCILEEPESSGEVRLTSNRIQDTPNFNLTLPDNQMYREHMRDAVRMCVQTLSHSSLSEIIEEVTSPTPGQAYSDQELDQWIRATVAHWGPPSVLAEWDQSITKWPSWTPADACMAYLTFASPTRPSYPSFYRDHRNSRLW